MNLKEAIQRLAGTFGKANFKTFDANVESVDVPTRTCVVNSLDSSVIGLTVRFMVEVSDGDMSVPQKDSTVIVAMTDFTEPYIVSKTWLDNKLIVIGNQSIDVLKDKQIYNDGAYKGWATVINPDVENGGLLKRYNLLEQDINTLKGKLNDIMQAATTANVTIATWTAGVPLTDVVAAGVFLPFMNTIISALTPYIAPELIETTEEMISNPNITHGKKFE